MIDFYNEFNRAMEEYERLLKEYERLKDDLKRTGLRVVLYAVKVVGDVRKLAEISDVSEKKIRKFLVDGYVKNTKLNQRYVAGLREIIDKFVQGESSRGNRVRKEAD